MKYVHLLIVAGAAAPALAQVNVTSQSRSVHALWSGGDVTVAAPDFGPFVASVGAVDKPPFGTGAIAEQDSTISPNLFSFGGNVTAYRSGSLAESIYEVGFNVATPADFLFDGTVAGGNIFGSGILHAILTGPDGELFNATAFDIPGNGQEIHQSGILAPGEYTLRIRFHSQGLSTSIQIEGQGSAVMTIVPAPSVGLALAASMLLPLRRRR